MSTPCHVLCSAGVAVMTVMTFTTLLVCLVMLMTWNLHPLLVALFVIVYLPLEGAFLSATLVKVPNGGKLAMLLYMSGSCLYLLWPQQLLSTYMRCLQ